jgi:hypothetical protein
MTQPGKSASRPLMSIEDTIYTRLSLNVEFEFWIKSIWPYLQNNNEDKLIRKIMHPIRLIRLMESSDTWLIESAGLKEAGSLSSEKYDKEKKRILRFVGEFY